MISTRRLLVVLAAVCALLVGTTFTASASSAADRGTLTMPSVALAAADTPTATPSSQECTKMEVSNPVKWFALDAKSQPILDQPVQSYPSGTKAIAAGFDFNCIPNATYVTSVFYFGSASGDPVNVSTIFGQPSNNSATWWNSFYYTDGSSIPDGEWYVEFYRDVKEPLASGHITVGAKTADAAQVGVQGTVLDRQSRNPIQGAFLTLLNPGVSGNDWANNAMDPADVYASGQSDANG
jgi:hypothetical protein